MMTNEKERGLHDAVLIALAMLAVLFCALFVATASYAQSTVAVDITKAKFVWTFTQGTGGAVASSVA